MAGRELKPTLRAKPGLRLVPGIRRVVCQGTVSSGAESGGELAVRLFQALLVSPHVKAVLILDLILGPKRPLLAVRNEAGSSGRRRSHTGDTAASR